jgi:uncharacterized protein (TIGR00266 family)
MDAQIRGTTMPVLEVRLDPGESVVAESGELGWVTDSIELQTSTALAGSDGMWDAAKRSFGGGSFFMTEYSATTAPGVAVFPARLPGSIINVPLGPEHSYIVQRGGFLAGTFGCELATAFHPKKIGSGLFGGFGFVLQKLSGVGHAWIALGGEISEYELAAGETIRVHPGHVGLLDGTVTYELTTVPGLKNKVFGGDGLFLMRLGGPGKVWLQSMNLADLAGALAPYLPEAANTSTTVEASAGTAAISAIGKLLG